MVLHEYFHSRYYLYRMNWSNMHQSTIQYNLISKVQVEGHAFFIWQTFQHPFTNLSELEIRSVTTILKAMMSVSDGVIIIVRVGRYRNCPFKAVVIGGQSVKCHFLFTNNCERLVISWESFQIFTAIQTTDFQIYTVSTIFTNSLQSVTQRNYAQRTNKHAFFKFHTKSYKNICRGWIGKKHAILNFILSTRSKR